MSEIIASAITGFVVYIVAGGHWYKQGVRDESARWEDAKKYKRGH